MHKNMQNQSQEWGWSVSVNKEWRSRIQGARCGMQGERNKERDTSDMSHPLAAATRRRPAVRNPRVQIATRDKKNRGTGNRELPK